ncbi:triggering receptor expressed on myeloid cells 1 isoform X1 [Acinonyx jubatus]|uniref:Triggering receptor expressed on myeloid cells 1 n=1 Tax=Acinonyx jubatus TaxID=32536 RepID=A0ABM3Q4F5_ACIJB|nr:triggering receptor expressed on myeloid cells 1 isoform X1 [Acinonyx jubatus]
MKKAGLWGLLWMVFISELQAENESKEEKFIKEGETLNVNCPFSTEKYSYSQKAWQKLIDGRKPVTLAFTTSTSGNPSQVREGRYFLEDIPSEAILHVQMTNLQVEDSGLYRCVIYYLSKEPDVLSPLFHVVVIKDPLNTTASDENHTRKLQISTFPPTTTRAQGTLVDRPRTVTKLPPKSTADLSSPGFGVNITNVTDVTSYVFRIPSCRRRGETKVTASWRDLDHSLLFKCHALLQPEGLAAENGTSQENQQRQSGSRARQPPGVSPGHSTPREADLTFQELMGMPSSPNKYHTPLCSVVNKRLPELLL